MEYYMTFSSNSTVKEGDECEVMEVKVNEWPNKFLEDGIEDSIYHEVEKIASYTKNVNGVEEKFAKVRIGRLITMEELTLVCFSRVSGLKGLVCENGIKGCAVAEEAGNTAVAMGIQSKAKGVKGSYLILSEWKNYNANNWKLDGIVGVPVDGEKIKADTWYKAVDGKAVEAV